MFFRPRREVLNRPLFREVGAKRGRWPVVVAVDMDDDDRVDVLAADGTSWASAFLAVDFSTIGCILQRMCVGQRPKM